MLSENCQKPVSSRFRLSLASRYLVHSCHLCLSSQSVGRLVIQPGATTDNAKSLDKPVHLSFRLSCKGDSWLSRVPRLPLCAHAPVIDPGPVSRILAHYASLTAAFHRLQGVGFHPDKLSGYLNDHDYTYLGAQ